MPENYSILNFALPSSSGRADGKLAQVAYETLLRKIVSLDFAPGATLQERQLAEVLSMSRTPLREALTRLSHEGWVHIRARRSIEVKPVNADTVREVFEVREMLESRGVDQIVNDPTNHTRFVNLSLVHKTMTNMHINDFDYILTNQKFHAYLSTQDSNSLIYGLWNRMHLENVRLGVLAVSVHPRRKEAVQDEHRDIIRALLQKDGPAARTALLEHLRTIRGNLERVLAETL